MCLFDACGWVRVVSKWEEKHKNEKNKIYKLKALMNYICGCGAMWNWGSVCIHVKETGNKICCFGRRPTNRTMILLLLLRAYASKCQKPIHPKGRTRRKKNKAKEKWPTPCYEQLEQRPNNSLQTVNGHCVFAILTLPVDLDFFVPKR